jgi:hypothetical protein
MPHPRPSTPTEKKFAKSEVDDKVVFVLGAGVDRVLQLPLLNTLFRDLNAFVSGSGADINKAIRSQVKGMRFNLQTYGGDGSINPEAFAIRNEEAGWLRDAIQRLPVWCERHFSSCVLIAARDLSSDARVLSIATFLIIVPLAPVNPACSEPFTVTK